MTALAHHLAPTDARRRAAELRRLADDIEASAIIRLDLGELRAISDTGVRALCERLLDRNRHQLLEAADDLRGVAWRLDPFAGSADRRIERARRTITDAGDQLAALRHDDPAARHLRAAVAATRLTIERYCIPALTTPSR